MKPFKFFFALSLGVILFLFFARFAILAFIAAAFLSFGYFCESRGNSLFDLWASFRSTAISVTGICWHAAKKTNESNKIKTLENDSFMCV